MIDWNELADLLDREIERANLVVSNSVTIFRKNVRAYILNETQNRISAEAQTVLGEVTARCEELAQHLDHHGARSDDDETQSYREAAKLAVRRLRDLRGG